MKKFLCILLVLSMILSAVSIPAFAEDEADGQAAIDEQIIQEEEQLLVDDIDSLEIENDFDENTAIEFEEYTDDDLNLEATYSGTCGDNLTWSLDTNTGKLTISGTGNMYDYDHIYSGGGYITTVPWGHSYIKSVEIGNSVTSIGAWAFCYCDRLTSVEIPDSVTSIGHDAFYKCTSLTSVEIPDSITSIGNYVFRECTNLTSVTIPDSVTIIGDGAFDNTGYYNDSSNWENNVLYIGKHLIGAKTSISGEYKIKVGTKTIANSAFYNCTSLTSVEIPDSITSIGNYVFRECTNLTSVTIPDSVTSIGRGAFRYCDRLTSVTIPDSVTTIGDDAFYYCLSLADVYYVGSKDGWNKISIGSYNSYLTNAKRHYMGRITVYNNDGSVKERVLVSRDASYALPYDEISGYTFYGYYTEKMGERTQITDNQGKSLEPFNFQNDINAYPFYFKPNSAAISGTPECQIGSSFTKSVEFLTDKDDVEYAIFDIKYPKNLCLKEITPKKFKYVTKDKEKEEGDYKIITLTCQYGDSGCVPANEPIKPFELSFTVNQDSKTGDFDISILDTSAMVGSSDYPFVELINDKITITPKLAESVTVSGDSTITDFGEYTAEVLPDYTTNKSVTWSVDNEEVATIDQTGKLTAHKNGTVTVKATAIGGAYGTKSVTVRCPAKLDSLTSDIGVWDETFTPDTYEYKISVPEECDSITLTPSFTGGTLKYNDGLWFNNRGKEISLPDTETTVILQRSGEDMIDSIYTLTVKRGNPLVIGDVNGDGSVNNKDWGIILNHVNHIIEYEGLPKWNDTMDYDPSRVKAADVNGDGSVNNKDWGIILNHVNHIIEYENLPKW